MRNFRKATAATTSGDPAIALVELTKAVHNSLLVAVDSVFRANSIVVRIINAVAAIVVYVIIIRSFSSLPALKPLANIKDFYLGATHRESLTKGSIFNTWKSLLSLQRSLGDLVGVGKVSAERQKGRNWGFEVMFGADA